jgi:hypothetical protein
MAAISYTLTSARKSALPDIERINGFNVKYSIPFSDFGGTGSTATAATDVVTIALGNTPALWMVDAALANVTTAWVVTGTQTVTVSVGTTTNVGAFITAQSVTTIAPLYSSKGKNQPETVTQSFGTSAVGLVAVFTNAGVGSLSLATAGQLDVFLNVMNIASGQPGTLG